MIFWIGDEREFTPTALATPRMSAFSCACSLTPNFNKVMQKGPGDTCMCSELHYYVERILSLGNLDLL